MPFDSGWRRHAAACAVLLVVGVVRWHGALFDAALATDEVDYTRAFAEVDAGRNPYAVERFLYPPPFALAGAALVERLGEHRAVLVLRGANLLGAVALVWICLGWSAWPWRTRLLIGSALLALWAPVAQSVAYGNISLAVLGSAFGALAWLPARPLLAGVILGLGLAVKPLVPAIVALLPAWRPLAPTPSLPSLAGAERRTPAPWLTPVAAAAALGLALLWGRDLLAAMLAHTNGPLPVANSLALARLLRELGVDLPSVVLLGLALAVGAAVLRARPRLTAELAVLAGTAAIYALPIVWTHTLALTLPAQVLAFERAGRDRALAGAGSSARRRATWILAGLAALALAVQGSPALAALDPGRPWVRILCLLPVVAAPALFAYAALRRDSLGASTSGIGATVGQ